MYDHNLIEERTEDMLESIRPVGEKREGKLWKYTNTNGMHIYIYKL
jgi:hypothetical protein